jgi:hypothetical protein
MENKRFRILTNSKDKVLKINLEQSFDFLEVLSLKFTQSDVYKSVCSDYGVVCGRVTANNGFGLPNAKVSIFIPLDEIDETDNVISTLYPYKSINDVDGNNYRYNLLAKEKQHSGHEPTGTFPSQDDIMGREEILEVYEKYYKYTTKTNESGDFMIWGVPVGQQTLHIDIDLSDIGCFSLRPYDFIMNGVGIGQFKTKYSFKSSENIDSLPQIVSFNQTIDVAPFWGSIDECQIGLTRADFDLSDKGIKIEPTAYLIGSIFSDSGKNSINRNCIPRGNMGDKCQLVAGTGMIEALRFTIERDGNNRPIIEDLGVIADIDEDGSFVAPIKMNMDYVYTNEYGENEYTNDPNKGIATGSCYRFRITMNNDTLGRVRYTASYLLPNIKEYSLDVNKSYAWSTDYDDYPKDGLTELLYNDGSFYYPQNFFYRLNYNKVYTVSSLHGSHISGSLFASSDSFIGLKELHPDSENDCDSSVLTPPVNFGIKNFTFSLLIAEILGFLEHLLNLVILNFFNVITKNVFHPLADAVDFWPIRSLSSTIRDFAYKLQNSGQKQMFLVNYPECVECNSDELGTPINDNVRTEYCTVGTMTIKGSTNLNERTLEIPNYMFTSYDEMEEGYCRDNVRLLDNTYDLVSYQNDVYGIMVLSTRNTIFLDDSSPIYLILENNVLKLVDNYGYFSDDIEYEVEIIDKRRLKEPTTPDVQLEEGCAIYDTLYDENLIKYYYTNSGLTQGTYIKPQVGQQIYGTIISDDGYKLPKEYNPLSKSGESEFRDGIFTIIPGTQSGSRLTALLNEYRRRKRIGKLFCGGIVNYSFIDNWLSGSLYFFPFKSTTSAQGNPIYCGKVVKHIPEHDRFYYRSSFYNVITKKWGETYNNNKIELHRPTTLVDLGPRDEFIKEICVDPSLDPNCSVVRDIGQTTFKNFGELMGLFINYRMDTTNGKMSLNDFFSNKGFQSFGFTNPLAGDILQLISTNNEVGIEGFDLQNPKYLGYSYQILDPETYPNIFKNGTNEWGALPITMRLDEDGERTRLCLNEPSHIDYNGKFVNGRLTESSQKIPFYLWEKGGRGFGPYNDAKDAQRWDYTNVEIQPLQGMTYGYNVFNTGNTLNDSSDRYMLLPITYTNSGETFNNVSNNAINNIEFNIISLVDNHLSFNNEFPGFSYLYVTSGTTELPINGILYIRYGEGGTWQRIYWNYTMDFIIPKTVDYYSETKQILSTPFLFYFGLKPNRTALDKFNDLFGPKNAFN